jgi:AbrB family looped-hinge helix DNA binding protein
MHATIDSAGRPVIPKVLRDRLGLRAGEVEVAAEGSGSRVEPVAATELHRVGGRLVIPPFGHAAHRRGRPGPA